MNDRLTDAELAEIEERFRFATSGGLGYTDAGAVLAEIRRLRAIEAAARSVMAGFGELYPNQAVLPTLMRALSAALDGGGG